MGGTKVFLVDDHPMVMNGLQSCLEQEEDIQVIGVFHSGAAVLEQLQKGIWPDLIITDVCMKSISGFDLTRTIRTKYGSEIKVIMLTGYYFEEYMKTAFELGVHAFICKESPYSGIVNAIRQSMLGNVLIPETFQRAGRKESLTVVEAKVLQFIAKEWTNVQIAEKLDVSKRTIENHITSILNKLNVDSRVGAVVQGIQRGIIGPYR
ncbi:response regulator transcription factor [Paenibacillus sp. GSMTC-2017]|uniref:response regulator transcription factor n=1 Tax=Paenibacillus sp. GSMTC-2017 TaxID=2794350 RepID=UPI0018D78D33|nr:response regulator transcription factor [Paenibacillus sp. GSMTC-2017]MBH5318813.1 response regulator transcription factor [Paenibacillus sp. GSMTC-2017]